MATIKHISTLLLIAVIAIMPLNTNAQVPGVHWPYDGMTTLSMICTCPTISVFKVSVTPYFPGLECIFPIPGVNYFREFMLVEGAYTLGTVSFPTFCGEINPITGCQFIFACFWGTNDGTSIPV